MSHDDLRHTINRSHSRVHNRETAYHDLEGTSSVNPTYYADSGQAQVEVKIRNLEKQIGDMAQNMNRKPIYKQADTETESTFSSAITSLLFHVSSSSPI